MALWHQRFGNMSERGMQVLHSRNILPGLKRVDFKFYENCVYGKQNRVRFLRVGKKKTKNTQSLLTSQKSEGA